MIGGGMRRSTVRARLFRKHWRANARPNFLCVVGILGVLLTFYSGGSSRPPLVASGQRVVPLQPNGHPLSSDVRGTTRRSAEISILVNDAAQIKVGTLRFGRTGRSPRGEVRAKSAPLRIVRRWAAGQRVFVNAP